MLCMEWYETWVNDFHNKYAGYLKYFCLLIMWYFNTSINATKLLITINKKKTFSNVEKSELYISIQFFLITITMHYELTTDKSSPKWKPVAPFHFIVR